MALFAESASALKYRTKRAAYDFDGRITQYAFWPTNPMGFDMQDVLKLRKTVPWQSMQSVIYKAVSTAFRRLIDLIRFDPTQDKLWLVGDLVNRGPDSLATLRYIKQAGDAMVVLGNHDLHLLMAAAGIARNHPNDTCNRSSAHLTATNCYIGYGNRNCFTAKALMPWYTPAWPSWSIAQAVQFSTEVENALRQNDYPALFSRI